MTASSSSTPAVTAEAARVLVETGLGARPATAIGSPPKLAPRFAAFAEEVGIDADDYDDRQLAVAPDRVYGLLTHPTAPALPAALAMGEALGKSGAEVMPAYHLGGELEALPQMTRLTALLSEAAP